MSPRDHTVQPVMLALLLLVALAGAQPFRLRNVEYTRLPYADGIKTLRTRVDFECEETAILTHYPLNSATVLYYDEDSGSELFYFDRVPYRLDFQIVSKPGDPLLHRESYEATLCVGAHSFFAQLSSGRISVVQQTLFGTAITRRGDLELLDPSLLYTEASCDPKQQTITVDNRVYSSILDSGQPCVYGYGSIASSHIYFDYVANVTYIKATGFTENTIFVTVATLTMCTGLFLWVNIMSSEKRRTRFWSSILELSLHGASVLIIISVYSYSAHLHLEELLRIDVYALLVAQALLGGVGLFMGIISFQEVEFLLRYRGILIASVTTTALWLLLSPLSILYGWIVITAGLLIATRIILYGDYWRYLLFAIIVWGTSLFYFAFTIGQVNELRVLTPGMFAALALLVGPAIALFISPQN